LWLSSKSHYFSCGFVKSDLTCTQPGLGNSRTVVIITIRQNGVNIPFTSRGASPLHTTVFAIASQTIFTVTTPGDFDVIIESFVGFPGAGTFEFCMIPLS
jgi:hypothetical protein